MIHLINRFGGDMWVADNRLDKYLAAGNKLAAPSEKPTEPDKEPVATSQQEVIPEIKIPEEKPVEKAATVKKAPAKTPAKRKK